MSQVLVNTQSTPKANARHASFVNTSTAEAELMKRLCQRDESAMEQLVELYGGSLHRLVKRLSAWSDDTDDILQDVFLVAWNRAASFHGDGSLEGWLKRIAINRCHNRNRKRNSFKRVLTSATRFLTNEKIDRQKNAESALADTELTRAGIAKLKPEDRTILVLFYLEETQGSEVAELLQIKTEAVHVRLHRARQRLKKVLTEMGADS